MGDGGGGIGYNVGDVKREKKGGTRGKRGRKGRKGGKKGIGGVVGKMMRRGGRSVRQRDRGMGREKK